MKLALPNTFAATHTVVDKKHTIHDNKIQNQLDVPKNNVTNKHTVIATPEVTTKSSVSKTPTVTDKPIFIAKQAVAAKYSVYDTPTLSEKPSGPTVPRVSAGSPVPTSQQSPTS